MRITSIELAGTSKTTLSDGTPGLPRALALISRKGGGEFITVELLAPGGPEHVQQVLADDAGDQWSMAQILQHALDGHKGTNGDIDEYYRAIQMLGD